MKTKRVFRYYCDHCKKAGQSKYWIRRHESSCVKNPERSCRFCSFIESDEPTLPLASLVAVVRAPGATVDKLREAARGCPACMLAAIVHSGCNENIRQDEEGYPPANEFSLWRFTDEKAQFWRDLQP